MRKLFGLLLVLGFWCTSAWALIGTPCDPETDFEEVYMVRNWKSLPHKNQEETADRVAEVNSESSSPKWTHDPTPNTPLYACLSYGASSMADWWALELGWKLGTYKSYTNNAIETGFNPRKLELRYRKRAKLNPVWYYMVRIYEKDPITKEPVPIRPSGYARILTSTAEETLTDQIGGQSFVYRGNDYPMEGEWFKVVGKNWNRDNAEEKLQKALLNFGPLYVQFEIPGKHYLFGTHAPIVVGVGKLPGGKIVFICHDSFGNFPKDYQQDGKGASAYRYICADEIDEAIVFPHRIYAKASRSQSGVTIRFINKGGRGIPVRRAFYRTASGKNTPLRLLRQDSGFLPLDQGFKGKVKVYVEADYYMNKDGEGHWLTLSIP